MASVIFAEQTLSDFALNESVGFYMAGRGSQFELTAGKTYRVIWDNEEYICTAYEGSYLGMTYTTVYLGNESYVTGQNTEIVEPFVIYYISDNDYNVFVSVSTETSHVIAIYEVEESEEDNTQNGASKGCSIVLYDRTGVAVTYENVETITTDTPEAGVQAVFTHGEVMQGVEVELALAEGDQTLSVPKGYLVKKAVIKKPTTLLPENIRKDVSIGGVTGTLIGTGVEKTVDLNMSDGNQVVEADKETLMSKVVIMKPETLVPENIAKGVEMGGIIGTLELPQLFALRSAFRTKISTTGLVVLYVYRYEENGSFALRFQLVNTDTGEVLIEKDAGSATKTDYIYAHEILQKPLIQPFHISARLTGAGFAPSKSIEIADDMYLTDIVYKLEGCVSDYTYERVFAGSIATMTLTPNEGYCIAKSVGVIGTSGEIEYTYDNFTGILSFDVPEEESISIHAIAPTTPWLHEPVVLYEEDANKLTVQYIDENAENTSLIYNGEIVVELEPPTVLRYSIEDILGATYGFALTSDGYYTSQNAGKKSSYSLCKVVINAPVDCTCTIDCISYGENNYDYGILSNLDSTLALSYSADSSNVYKSFKGLSSSSVQTVTYTVPAGEHFIYIKYIKDSSGDSYNDSLKFKITLTFNGAGNTSYNLADYFTNYGLYPLTIKSIAEGYTDSDALSMLYTIGPTIDVDSHGCLTITECIGGISSFGIYIDDVLVDTVAYDYSESWSVYLGNYVYDEEYHDIYVNAIGEGFAENRSNIVNAYTRENSIYGVSGMSGTATTLTRTDQAIDMGYVINDDGSINSDFNNAFPWNETRIVTDSSGSDFLQFPTMYFRVGKSTSSYAITDIAVSNLPHKDGNWFKVEPFCYGRYGASLSDTKLESKTGATRISKHERSACRTYASNNGDNYHLLDLYHNTVLKFLWWIEWGTKKASDIMTGRTHGSGTAGGQYVRATTGGTDGIATPSGYELQYAQMRYHYIEDFIGNLYEWCDGLFMNASNSNHQATSDYTKFNDSFTGYEQLPFGDPYSTYAYNCITAYGWSDSYPFLCTPLTVADDSTYTTGFCAKFEPASGAGQAWVGASYLYSATNYNVAAIGSVRTADAKYGARLLYAGEIEKIIN